VHWRETRRLSARSAVVDAAWAVVAEAGLAGLSMRDLAKRAGTTTPTLYAYFDSKNAIYDAMFGQAAQQFAAHMTADYQGRGTTEVVAEALSRFIAFCLADVPRYQLLFQRTIPGFEPTPES
jgi:AcrR family transcriptional regulator